MKAKDFTSSELLKLNFLFTETELYKLRDKSLEQTFESGDLILIRYIIRDDVYNTYTRRYEYNKRIKKQFIGSYISSEPCGKFTEYTVENANGRKIVFDVCCLKEIYHLNLTREIYTEALRKYEDMMKKKEQELKRKEHLEQIRIKEEQEAKRIREYEEQKRAWEIEENKRRSETVTITVGILEDIKKEIESLNNRIRYLEE